MESTLTQQSVEISTKNMQCAYANMVRGLMTAEEVILDFGVNPNLNGKIVEEPAEMSHRIVLSLPSAVRLHQLLQTMLARRQQAVQEARNAAAEQVAAAPQE